MEIPSDKELENKSKSELILLIKTIHNKFLEKPKTSEAQIRAMKNYYSKKSSSVCETRKKYYERMKQNPEWVEKQRQISRENYNKKKILTIN